MARKFFMENHPMRDLLGTVYDQYFLTYLKYNSSTESRIFAYGFLFKSAFFQQNIELMRMFYEQIKLLSLSSEIHVIPAGLKYGVELLYEDFILDTKAYKNTVSDMKKWRSIFVPASEKSVCSFEYSVLELLIFTERKKELTFLLKNQTVQIYPDEVYIPKDRQRTHQEVWKILSAIAHQKLGKTRHCKTILDTVDLEALGLGWKNFYSLLFYKTAVEVGQNDHKNSYENALRKQAERLPYFQTK